jgi:preprotein translocase subunit SecD
MLVALVVLIVIMLAGVIGAKSLFEPSHWHQRFKVALGLDLAGGTTVTLQADTPRGQVPAKSSMNIASQIMLNRVNSLGTSGAQVQLQGNNEINVTVPGKGSQAVIDSVGTTAQLAFRQVLLVANGFPSAAAPTPPTPTPLPPVSSSPSPGTSPLPGTSPSASTKGSGSGQAQSVSARQLTAGGSAALAAKPKASPSPATTVSPSPTPTSSAPGQKLTLPTTKDATGNASLVTPAVAALFDKLNCQDKNWQKVIYPKGATAWDDAGSQVVACGPGEVKYVLDLAKVTGTQVGNPAAALDPTNNQWVINFNLKGAGVGAFGNLTSMMVTKYYSATTNQPTSVLDELAVVLDGKVITAPDVVGASTAGASQITGSFTQASATQLADILRYGSLPLTFQVLQTASVSQQLGAAQLDAGFLAAGVGLLLVVLYSFLYYRGLGVVSVSSLAIAAVLAYLSVVLLSRYQGLTMSLASIAGLIVAIGITADSFVVFFERLRDEVREGKTLRSAVERGWHRARRTILVSDTVSFLAAALLYYFAIGDVKGFAYTLGLTTVIDVVVVFLFTKPMVTLLARTEFYGRGHKLSGLDPARLGARSPWRGSRRPVARPAGGMAAVARPDSSARTTPKEA